MLKGESISQCIELNRQAIQEHVPTVVQWQDGNYVHTSVYNFTVQSTLVDTRCIVTFHVENGQLGCQCGKNCDEFWGKVDINIVMR